MDIISIIMLSIGLAMDAFAVSMCKGLAIKELNIKKSVIIGLWFGGFQALMPLIGYILGTQFSDKIEFIDHWIAFILLAFIGANMIKEALSKEEEKLDESLNFKTMILLAIATSIDALTVGITFATFKVNVAFAVLSIGVITFILSIMGTKLGNIFGVKYKSKAEILGGIILISLGVKVLVEHILT